MCGDANGRFAPTPIIISGDESVKDEIKGTPDGRVETHFAERIVFIANHLVPDFMSPLTLDLLGLALPLVNTFFKRDLTTRWVSYTSEMHGAIYIILKDSLKWVPIIGWGMQFYGFSILPLASF
jgi:1-acyl-sn-glycerol-3-phosphate acyltransferase